MGRRKRKFSDDYDNDVPCSSDLASLEDAIYNHRGHPFRQEFSDLMRLAGTASSEPWTSGSRLRHAVLMYCWNCLGWRPSQNSRFIYVSTRNNNSRY